VNKDYNQKKKMAVIGLSVLAVCLAGGLFYYVSKLSNNKPTVTIVQSEVETAAEITVPEIVPETTIALPVESSTQAETETEEVEAVLAESEEETTSAASTQTAANTATKKTSENKPKSPTEATPPAEAPVLAEQTAAVENPDANGQCQPETTAPATQPEGGSTNSSGAVYVPGFGYVEPSGAVEGKTSYTDGDWNKQIGVMQ